MKFLGAMFSAASIASVELKKAVAKSAGDGGTGFRKNKRTIATGRALLLAYAMQARAKRDIGMLLRM